MTTLMETFQRQGFVFAVYMLGNADDAADAVQDGLSAAWNHRDVVRSAHDPTAWFFRVLRNKCVDRLRERSKRRTEELFDAADQRASDGESDAARRELAEALRVELSKLDPVHREMLVLRDVQGMSYAQIADVLSIPAGTVMSRLHRARMTLRDRLKGAL